MVLRIVDNTSGHVSVEDVPVCWDKQTDSILVPQTLKQCLAFHTELTKMDNSRASSEVQMLIYAGSRCSMKQYLLHPLSIGTE